MCGHGSVRSSSAWAAGLGKTLGVFVLVLALLWGQTLGQLHRVVHAKPATAHAVVVADAAKSLDTVWQGLWGEHASLADCQLFDQACPDALQHAVWTVPVLPLPVAGLTLTLYARFALAEHFFAARAPPLLR